MEKENKRGMLVVKQNDLIQKAKYNLTFNQQKLISYLISEIKPTDKELQWQTITISEYCELFGIDKEHFYQDFISLVNDLNKKEFWIESDKELSTFRWFSEVKIMKKTGKIKILLNSSLKQYLIEIKQNFTNYELYNIMALKSKYSIRLYELFKSYEFQKHKEFEIGKLKFLLDAESYTDFRNFRRDILKTAIDEINTYTDISASFETIKTGKSVSSIKFTIEHKQRIDELLAYRKTINKLDNT